MKKILSNHSATVYSRKSTGKKTRQNIGCVIYYDPAGRCKQIVYPCTDIGAKNRFDGDWAKLVQHITKGIYQKFELI